MEDKNIELSLDNMSDDDLRSKFEELRSKIIKKCNGCVKIYVDKDEADHCNGWTKNKCIWECDGEAKDLVEQANKIADHFALTEEDINALSAELESHRSENSKLMENILETHPDTDKQGVVKETMEVTMDPYTGKISNVKPYEKTETYSMNDLIFGNIRASYTESTVDQIADTYGITKNDAYRVLNIIRNKDTTDLYKKLPLAMRNVVDNTINIETQTYDEAAKELLLQFQSDTEMNEQLVDLDKSIRETWNDAYKEIGDVELTTTRDIFVNKMREEAEKISTEVNEMEESQEKSDKLEQINKILGVSQSYEDSYHYKKQLQYLESISQKNKRKVMDVSKYNSVINTFNDRYRFNTRNIKDIRMVLPILYRKLHPSFKWVTEDLIQKFIMLTCLACDKMMPENLVEHTYMFYTVQNLALLDLVDIKNKNEWPFAEEILNNTLYVLDILRDIPRKKKNIKWDPQTLLPIIPDMLNNQLNDN